MQIYVLYVPQWPGYWLVVGKRVNRQAVELLRKRCQASSVRFTNIHSECSYKCASSVVKRCNAAWPFRGEPSSDQAVPTAATCGVRGVSQQVTWPLVYNDITHCTNTSRCTSLNICQLLCKLLLLLLLLLLLALQSVVNLSQVHNCPPLPSILPLASPVPHTHLLYVFLN